MSAYMIARVEISNPERYADYIAAAPAAVERHGGRFVVRGGEVTTLEGPDRKARWVVIEFESVLAAQTFYNSPEYSAARALRAGAAEAEFVVLDGYNSD